MYDEWDFHKVMPLYMQIAYALRGRIYGGKWKPGEIIPSVRDMAAFYHINPNTASRAYHILKQEELIVYCRGDRYTVTTDSSYIEKKSQEAVNDVCCLYFSQMLNLGVSEKGAIIELKAYFTQIDNQTDSSFKRGKELMKTILIVDDDMTFLNALAYAFQIREYEVLTATGVSEAKEILSKENISMICSDVHMNNGTGFELLDYVRSELPDLSFVLLSSDLTEEIRIQAKVLNAFCLEKTELDLVDRILQYEV